MNLILLGAHGAGKGKHSANIYAKYNVPAVSTGHMLRAAIKAGTDLGLSAKSYMDERKLVPDEVVVRIIKDYISTEACKNGFILDGFPEPFLRLKPLRQWALRSTWFSPLRFPTIRSSQE